MKRISQGSIRKRQKRNGKWEWRALLVVSEGGKKRQITKFTGAACAPLTHAERGSGRRVAPSGRGTAKATEFLRAWRDEVVRAEGGEQRVASGAAAMQMGDFVEAYWRTRNIKKSTLKGYHNLKKHIERLEGRACDVKLADVQQWILDEQKNKVGNAMIKKSYVQMKSAFKWAVKIQLLEGNPCTSMDPSKTERRDPNPLDETNLERLAAALVNLDAAGERSLADAVRLALFTGMREGELCGLRWRDVEGAVEGRMSVGGEMHINNTVEIVEGGTELTERPKNGKRRDVPINTDVLAVLERRRNEMASLWGEELDDIFVLGKLENPASYYNPSTLQKDWRAFRNVVGIKGSNEERVTFHDLRHTFATSALVRRDIDLVTVAGLLGHSSPRVTLDFYARWLPNENQAAMDAMVGLLDNARDDGAPDNAA
ncbi:MAG: site-specific integrase [Atopobiaceae bacterium]|nr:site-specific integrase [Atopobiaceae bacterium]